MIPRRRLRHLFRVVQTVMEQPEVRVEKQSRPDFTAGLLCDASTRVPALLLDATRMDPEHLPSLARTVLVEQVLTGAFRPVWLVTTDGHKQVKWTGHPIEILDHSPQQGDPESEVRYARRMHQIHATYEPWAEVALTPTGFAPGQLAYLRAFTGKRR